MRKVALRLTVSEETGARLTALVKKERMSARDLIAEALFIHLHRLETRAKPRLRRQALCPDCGKVAAPVADTEK